MVKEIRSSNSQIIIENKLHLPNWEIKLIDKKVKGIGLNLFQSLAHFFLNCFNQKYRTTYQAALQKIQKVDPNKRGKSQKANDVGTITLNIPKISKLDPWLEKWLKTPIDNQKRTWTIGDENKHPKADYKWQDPVILTLGTFDRLDDIEGGLASWRFEKHGRTDIADYLSNFYPCKLVIDGRSYDSVEHYYQAMKFPIDSDNYHNVVSAPDAYIARDRGRVRTGTKPCRDLDDDQEMSRLIKRALFAKFTDANGRPNALGKNLIASGNQPIFEGNRRVTQQKVPGDERWGVIFDPTGFTDNNELISFTGANMLGKMLMELREELQKR